MDETDLLHIDTVSLQYNVKCLDRPTHLGFLSSISNDFKLAKI